MSPPPRDERMVQVRIGIVLGLLVSLLVPQMVSAGSFPRSSISLSRAVIQPGQTETITVVARDLAGKPLPGAKVTANVTIGTTHHSYTLPSTDHSGKSTLTLKPSVPQGGAKVQVTATVRKGNLLIPLHTPGSAATQSTSGTSSAPFLVTIHLQPSQIQAPASGWIVVDVHDRHSHGLGGATVTVTVDLQEGVIHLTGVTDSTGIATLRLDTTAVRGAEKPQLSMQVSWHNKVTSSTAQLSIAAPSGPPPTNTPIAIPTAPPTGTPAPAPATGAWSSWTPSPTYSTPGASYATPDSSANQVAPPTFIPTPTTAPTSTPTTIPYATWTPQPTLVAVPSWTPEPTWTPLPTAAPQPTWTPTSVPTSAPTAAPTATATTVANCPGSQQACIQAMLDIINQTRAQYHKSALNLNMLQSTGTSSCVGSYGHSVDMAQSGAIWHENGNYPQASFPNDVCGYPSMMIYSAAENVGQCATGNEVSDMQCVNKLMMQEPYTPGCTGSHVCNILTDVYTRVGIGVYSANGATWITEDFIP